MVGETCLFVLALKELLKKIGSKSFALDCKTVGFFLKINKEIGNSLFSASFQTFCLTARAYLNTQKYGLFCSLVSHKPKIALQIT